MMEILYNPLATNSITYDLAKPMAPKRVAGVWSFVFGLGLRALDCGGDQSTAQAGMVQDYGSFF